MIEFVLILHFLVILFVFVGFPIGLKINHRGFRIFHACVLTFISALMVFGMACPLTILEEWLRGDAVYEGSFIATWLNRIIYLEGMDSGFVVYLAVAFTVLVATSFFWKPLARRQ
ncbi:MAG: DUF2784 domain-containing protein [Nitrospinae bacterium]|nr:DUF2784 domain-containing protein [Nitrospinota bacterium]